MNNQPDNSKINALLAKGGVMFFTIERQVCIYKGMVILSPLRDNCQRRAVYINTSIVNSQMELEVDNETQSASYTEEE